MSQLFLRAPWHVSVLTSTLMASQWSHAQALVVVEFNVPASTLERSLNAVARQAGAQVLFSSELTAGKQAPALQGRYTLEQALEHVLEHSGLVGKARDERTFIVVPPNDAMMGRGWLQPAVRWSWPTWRSRPLGFPATW